MNFNQNPQYQINPQRRPIPNNQEMMISQQVQLPNFRGMNQPDFFDPGNLQMNIHGTIQVRNDTLEEIVAREVHKLSVDLYDCNIKEIAIRDDFVKRFFEDSAFIEVIGTFENTRKHFLIKREFIGTFFTTFFENGVAVLEFTASKPETSRSFDGLFHTLFKKSHMRTEYTPVTGKYTRMLTVTAYGNLAVTYNFNKRRFCRLALEITEFREFVNKSPELEKDTYWMETFSQNGFPPQVIEFLKMLNTFETMKPLIQLCVTNGVNPKLNMAHLVANSFSTAKNIFTDKNEEKQAKNKRKPKPSASAPNKRSMQIVKRNMRKKNTETATPQTKPHRARHIENENLVEELPLTDKPDLEKDLLNDSNYF